MIYLIMGKIFSLLLGCDKNSFIIRPYETVWISSPLQNKWNNSYHLKYNFHHQSHPIFQYHLYKGMQLNNPLYSFEDKKFHSKRKYFLLPNYSTFHNLCVIVWLFIFFMCNNEIRSLSVRSSSVWFARQW